MAQEARGFGLRDQSLRGVLFGDELVYVDKIEANKPYRMKLRSPGFCHLSAMNEIAKGHMLADAVAIIGTLDIVFGDIDR